ncbi:hypothetical protein SLG_11540 [Sphingobium sp. SYK-6]|nr:hypothetical protein SLG_11540 [Sphingobium sp. SYK-6]
MKDFSAPPLIKGDQVFAFVTKVQKACSAFEKTNIAIFEHGHLTKGLTVEVVGLAVIKRDSVDTVGNTGLLASPA